MLDLRYMPLFIVLFLVPFPLFLLAGFQPFGRLPSLMSTLDIQESSNVAQAHMSVKTFQGWWPDACILYPSAGGTI